MKHNVGVPRWRGLGVVNDIERKNANLTSEMLPNISMTNLY
jgi:hypothetical protein